MTSIRRPGDPGDVGELDDLPPSPAASIRATWTRPVATHPHGIYQTLAAMPPAAPLGVGSLVTVVVDPDDTATFARTVAALACRRAGRAVVHTNPRQGSPWTLGIDVLCALGKHWDRVGQGCDLSIGPLVEVWLRAEQTRDLIVLRAHQLAGTARAWLLDLADASGSGCGCARPTRWVTSTPRCLAWRPPRSLRACARTAAAAATTSTARHPRRRRAGRRCG